MSLNRRKFLGLSTATSSALLFSAFDALAEQNKPIFTKNAAFELLIMATNWGFNGNADDFCAKAKKKKDTMALRFGCQVMKKDEPISLQLLRSISFRLEYFTGVAVPMRKSTLLSLKMA